MNDFTNGSCGCGTSDPSKRVHYSHGMVLGQDDLVQEQVYLRARDHRAVRALHGYGTVSGLDVTWEAGTRLLQVTPGLAVDPVGRLVCVPAAQCADLGAWLVAHRAEVIAAAAGGAVSVHVVLCHRDCPTDTVPVPAESCRTAEESMAPSRTQDSFDLRLLLDAPRQGGEVAGGALTSAVDRLLGLLESLPADSVVDVDPVRRALVAWATLHRPELGTAPCLTEPPENCGDRPGPSTGVLLARVDLEVDRDGDELVLAGRPEVDADERPVLLSTRFLQEWLTELVLHPELIGPPPITDHNALDNLPVGDVHTQYLPADGSRPLTGHLDGGGFRVTRVAASDGASDAVRQDEVFGADLRGGPAGARVARLQDTPVRAAGARAPGAGEVLTFSGAEGAWVPAPLPGGGPSEPRRAPMLPLVTIEPMGQVLDREIPDADPLRSVFWLWFHPDAPESRIALPSPDGDDLRYGEHLRILTERCREDGPPGLEEVDEDLVTITRLTCATFRIDLAGDREARNPHLEPLLRFVLLLERLKVVVDGADATLFDHTLAEDITWLGQDARASVTTFVLNPQTRAPLDGFKDVTAVALPPGGRRFTIPGAGQ